MVTSWLKNMIFGSISVKVSGNLLSVLLNQLNRAGIPMWKIKKTSNDTVTFTINMKDFQQFRGIVKNTASKFKIEKKQGLPFLQWRLMKRYMFLAGMLFFLLFLWTMSQFVWNITIIGHDGKNLAYEHEKMIRNELSLLGIKEGSWKRRMPEKDVIQRHLREQLNRDYIWIGLDLQGTNMSITAVPLSKPNKEENILPSNIIATKNAVIHRILAYEGVAYVQTGQRVYPGQILVAGYLSEEKKIAAKGVVEGVVWYTVDVELPLKRTVETYTGEAIKKYRFVYKNWSIPLYLPKSILDIGDYDKRTSIKKLSWRSLSVPIEYHIDTYYKTKTETILVKQADAEQMAVQMAIDSVEKMADFKEVVSHTIMKYNIDSDSDQFNVRLLLEVIEDIAMRKLITDSDFID